MDAPINTRLISHYFSMSSCSSSTFPVIFTQQIYLVVAFDETATAKEPSIIAEQKLFCAFTQCSLPRGD